MEQLLLNEVTRRQFDAFVQSGAHALLIIGAPGSGKSTTATALAARILGVKTLENAPYFKEIGNTGPITIEQIRELQQFLQLKTTGRHVKRRIVVLHGSDTMGDEAQNALLKSLEEPPIDTVLILTAADSGKLKQTILSRVQVITLGRIEQQAATSFFLKHYAAKDIAWAYALSDGQIGLMTALLSGMQDHPIAAQIANAKVLLSSSVFERLIKVDELSKNKQALQDLLYALRRIAVSGLESSAKANDADKTKAWHSRLSVVYDAEVGLKSNTNTKLLLTDLFLNL